MKTAKNNIIFYAILLIIGNYSTVYSQIKYNTTANPDKTEVTGSLRLKKGVTINKLSADANFVPVNDSSLLVGSGPLKEYVEGFNFLEKIGPTADSVFTLAGLATNIHDATDLYDFGNRVYAVYNGKVHVYNYENINNPVFVTSFPGAANYGITNLKVNGIYAYFSVNNSFYMFLRHVSGAFYTQTSNLSVPETIEDLYYGASHVHVLAGNKIYKYQVFANNDVDQVEIYSLPSGVSGKSIEGINDHLFIACNNNKLYSFQSSASIPITLKDSISDLDLPFKINMRSNVALLLGNSSLVSIDVGNPSNLLKLQSFSLPPNGSTSLDCSDEYLAVTGVNFMRIYNIKNPYNIVYQSIYSTPEYVYDVAVLSKIIIAGSDDDAELFKLTASCNNYNVTKSNQKLALKSGPWNSDGEVSTYNMVHKNFGVGVPNPTQKFMLKGGASIDEKSRNYGSLDFSLRFGSPSSGEAITSQRNSGLNQYGLDIYTNSTNRITITNGGNIGIGTSTLDQQLTVDGGITLNLEDTNNTPTSNGLVFGNESTMIGSRRVLGDNRWGLYFSTTLSSDAMKITNAGNILINAASTSSPNAKVEINGSANHDFTFQYGYLNSTSPVGIDVNPTSQPYSLYASHRIAASEFNAYSDRRIKKEIIRSKAESDLELIKRINVYNYKLIDTISKGKNYVKGFIAQQLETVMPNAVHSITDVIPDIYKKGEFMGKNKILIQDHNLVIGDKVRLLFDKIDVLVQVKEITSDGFVFDHESVKSELDRVQSSSVFVFGKEVKDFRAIDYHQVFSASVSAIQQLYKEQQSLMENYQAIELIIKECEARIKVMDNK